MHTAPRSAWTTAERGFRNGSSSRPNPNHRPNAKSSIGRICPRGWYHPLRRSGIMTRSPSASNLRSKGCVVRAEGLEPSRTLRSNGFSYPSTAFAAPAISPGFGVWTIPSPCPDLTPGVRCCPSSLYTFPAVSGRAWLGIAMLQGSPNLSSSASPVSRRALKFFA